MLVKDFPCSVEINYNHFPLFAQSPGGSSVEVALGLNP